MTDKDIDRFHRIEALFNAALEFPPGADRDTYVFKHADETLVDEVRKLLKDHQRVSEAAPHAA